jgi:guanylate kinase
MKYFGPQAISIFVMPPSVEVLEQRLRTRATESEQSIHKRIEKAQSELEHAKSFDFILLNDDFDVACANAEKLVNSFLDLK